MKAQVKVPSFAAPRLGALRWLLVGATCLSAAAAQAQSPPPRVASRAYTNKPIFRLPFTLSPADRQRAQAVALYACCGDEPLALKETDSPAQTGLFRLSEAMEKNSTGLLRASARDRAGNFAMREAQIKLATPERAVSSTPRNRSDNLVVRSDKLAIPVEPAPTGPPQLTPANRDATETTAAMPAAALAGGRDARNARPDDR